MTPLIPFLMVLIVCWSVQTVDGQEGIGLILNNVQYPNNSVVNITDIGTGSAALFCTTTSTGCCLSTDGSNWYFPNGSAVQPMRLIGDATTYYRSRTISHIGGGTVRLHRVSEATTTGVFHCDILDVSGYLQSIYVGIYTATTGSPNVTSLVYDSQSRTLNCTSTGGPATTVTWRRDGVVITPNATKRVVDSVSGTYQTVLTIDSSMDQSDIVGTYNCTVENVRGRSSTTMFVFGNVLVSITSEENPTLGQSYTLTCNVTLASGVTGTPTVQWMRPGSSTPIATGGDFTVSSTSPYTLTINPLLLSHAGQYTCRAMVDDDTVVASLDIAVLTITASITSPTGSFTVGQSYTLTCTANVTGGDTMSTTTITLIHPSGSVTSGTGSSLNLSLNPLRVSDAGQYTCNVSVSSPFLTGAHSFTDMLYVNVHGIELSLNNVQYPNNSVVNITDIGTGSAALICTTTLPGCCLSTDGSHWYFPNGSAVQHMRLIGDATTYYRTRTISHTSGGTVRLQRISEATTTGIFHCDIRDGSGYLQSIYVGIYTATTGSPNVTSLVYDSQSRTLTCTSTGGPATTVTWRRDEVVITLNATYQQTMRVVDLVTGTYQTMLTIDPSVGQSDIVGTYNCTVENARGGTSMTVIVTVLVSITSEENPTLGQSYTLTCNVSVASGVTGTPTVQWVGPGSSTPVATGGDFTVSSTSPYTLTINPLRQSHAGQYTCQAMVDDDTVVASMTVDITVPSPTVSIDFATPGAVTYAGNNVTLNCGTTLLGGVTDSDVTVNNSWTKDGAPFSGVGGRVTLIPSTRVTSISYVARLIFSPLSSSKDNGTYTCITTLTPLQPQFVTGNSTSDSMALAVRVPTLTVTLTANTNRLPNVAPYNTFSFNCTATSRVEGVGSVALPKKFLWLRRYVPPDTIGLAQLTSNGTIRIQDGDNLTQPTSFSMLTVTEDIPQDYQYHCQVDLDLPADDISTLADVYLITVTSPSAPLQPSNLMSTGVTHNTATILWTVSRIPYTPENYTLHFGTSPGSLTPFSQQQQSGDNFTATNLQFSLQLTRLSAGTTYYYQVVAVNTVGSNQSTVRQFTTNELPPTPPRMFQITSVMTTSFSFSWQTPVILNGVLTGYQLSCQPLLSSIPAPQPLNTTAVMVTLSNLYPGVGYNCSIVARNSAGPSDPVYISGTTLETAPTGPPQSFTVTQRSARNVTFSWSSPAPTLRNGMITGYYLSCVPEAGGGRTITMQYTAAGTFTLGGFTPATSNNCSISTSNSQGSGPVAYVVVTTLDDAMLFQLQLSGTGLRNCQEWVGIATTAKLNDINNEVVQNINQRCQCGFSAECITEGAFQCFESSDQQVTFRARLHGTAQVTSSQLVAYLEIFVSRTDSTIAVQGLRLDVDRSCFIVINSFGDPQCSATSPSSLTMFMTTSDSTTANPSVTMPMTSDSTTTMAPQSDNTAAIIGGVVAVIIVVAVTVIIVALIAAFVTRSRRAKFSVHQDARKEPAKLGEVAKPSNEDIITTQCEAYELAKLGHEYEDLAVYQNPEYEISIAECSATRKSGE